MGLNANLARGGETLLQSQPDEHSLGPTIARIVQKKVFRLIDGFFVSSSHFEVFHERESQPLVVGLLVQTLLHIRNQVSVE